MIETSATIPLLTTERQNEMPKSSDNAYLIFIAFGLTLIGLGVIALLSSTFWPNS